MTEPLSVQAFIDLLNFMNHPEGSIQHFEKCRNEIVANYRLLRQRVKELEEESRQWEKENLVKLIKERDILKEENEHMSNLLIRRKGDANREQMGSAHFRSGEEVGG